MLVLRRNEGQQIIIADTITVTVLGISGNTVRLGIEAPKAVPVHRAEVQAKIERDGRAPPGFNKGKDA